MKDAEFIYSLYVQANPVPDPDLLPHERDEAVLLTLERSPDMITEERVQSPQPPPPKRRRLAAALGAAAVLIAAIAAVAILVNGGSGPVAAADAEPVVVFDGASCSYEGPGLIEEGAVNWSFANSAEETFYMYGWFIEEQNLENELAAHPIGADIDTDPDEGTPNGTIWLSATVEPGASADELQLLALLKPGFYLIDCGTGFGPTHVWRAAQIEVVAP